MWFSSGAHEALTSFRLIIKDITNYYCHRARQKSFKTSNCSSQYIINRQQALVTLIFLLLSLIAISDLSNQQQQTSSHASSYLPFAYAMQQQQQANSIQGLHQAMSQMLQVFNGNDSSQLEANNFKLLEVAGEDTLLIGAR